MSKAKRSNIVGQTFEIRFTKKVWPAWPNQQNLLGIGFETLQKHFLLNVNKIFSMSNVLWYMAELSNILLDKQISYVWPTIFDCLTSYILNFIWKRHSVNGWIRYSLMPLCWINERKTIIFSFFILFFVFFLLVVDSQSPYRYKIMSYSFHTGMV